MKRIFLFLLAAWMLVTTFVACAEPGTSQGTDNPGTETKQEGSDTEGEVDFDSMSFIEKLTYNRSQIEDELPEADFDGADFRVAFLYFDNSHMYTLDWEVAEDAKEVVDVAVYNRNLTVEERFDVTMKWVHHNGPTYLEDFTAMVTSGEDLFDMAGIHTGYFPTIVASGYAQNLYDVPHLDFEKPWWQKDSEEAYSYNDQLYMHYGTATGRSIMANGSVIFYNKQLANDMKLDNLYDVVKNGDWTADYFMTIVKSSYKDLNTNDRIDEDDQHGFSFPQMGQLHMFLYQFDARYIEKDSDGKPASVLNTPQMEQIFSWVKGMVWDTGVWMNDGYGSEIFQKGNTLFFKTYLDALYEWRNLDIDIGYLPNFKFDENQENYMTTCGALPQAIPVTCQDLNKAGLIMEALNAEGYKQIVPAYIKTAIQDKLSAEEDAEMLDIAFANVVFDGAWLFGTGHGQLLAEYVKTSKGFASFVEGKMTSLNTELESDLAKFDKIDD